MFRRKKKKENENQYLEYMGEDTTESLEEIEESEDTADDPYPIEEMATISEEYEEEPVETALSEDTPSIYSEDSGKETDEERYDPLELESEGEEYLRMEEKKKFPKKKVIIGIIIILGLIVAVITFIMKNLKGTDQGKVYVETVGSITGILSGNGINNRFTGVIEPQKSWNITIDSDLSVDKCFVEVGDIVKKGQKLFSYNTAELKLNKEKKQLEIETMQNEMNQLAKDIKGYEADLKDANTGDKIELQTQILTAQTTIKKDEYSVKSAKEELKDIEKNIKDATVKSKMAGVVKTINKSAGLSSGGDGDDTADMSADTSGTYMTILAVGDYRVKGKVSETNISSISEGDPVIVRSRIDDTTWKGTISAIKTESTTAEDDSQDSSMMTDDSDSGNAESASSYYFYVALKSDDGLMMGQHVFVERDAGQDDEKQGIWLSSAYILNEGNKYYAWVSNSKKTLEKREIKVGDYNEDLDEYEVQQGLSLEDYIACNDTNLTEGMKTTTVETAAEDNTGVDEEGLSDGEYYPDSVQDGSDEDVIDQSGYDESEIDQNGFDAGSADEGYVDESLDGTDEGVDFSEGSTLQ